MARLARQRAVFQGFAGMVRKECPGRARPGQAGMARSGRNGQAGRAWIGRHGFGRTARPALESLFAAGKAWPPVEALAWRCWLGEVGEAERGKARLARCGRARARHGWQRLVGAARGASLASLGAEGQDRQAWHGQGCRDSTGMAGEAVDGWTRLGLAGAGGNAVMAGPGWQVWHGVALTAGIGRHGVTRPGAIEAPQGAAGMEWSGMA